MADFYRDLVKILRANGFILIRAKGATKSGSALQRTAR